LRKIQENVDGCAAIKREVGGWARESLGRGKRRTVTWYGKILKKIISHSETKTQKMCTGGLMSKNISKARLANLNHPVGDGEYWGESFNKRRPGPELRKC